MNIRRLADRTRKLVAKRGGVDALKEDAAQLKDIAKGEGTLRDKAKKAAGALKEPGAGTEAAAEGAQPVEPVAEKGPESPSPNQPPTSPQGE